MVFLGDAEQVGDHQSGEGLGVFSDELALARAEELLELAVGEVPHELLVLFQPTRCQQPAQDRPRAGVVRRIHRDHVLEHRELAAVGVDLGGEVVAFGLEGQRREWPAERDELENVSGSL